LAEDNAVNRALAIRLLEKRGHKVVTAQTGKEALAILESTQGRGLDLVLMDIQMPEMDGLQATAMIRERERATGRHIPVIAMTAHALKSDRERCLAAGMDGYIPKPIHPDVLFNTIESFFASKVCSTETPSVESELRESVDKTALLTRVGGDAQLLHELIDLFLMECPRMMDEVRKALENQNAKTLERTAHALKGSVGNFNINTATDAALNLERMGQSGDLSLARVAFEDLEGELAWVTPALERIGKELCHEGINCR
jgi:CheY-like chemotaxis protein